MTDHPSSLPSFLCVGAQKAGTTSLHALLSQHPQVFLPAVKEVHYFSLHYGRGQAWYREQFAAAQADACCGEITPYYLFHPLAAGRIQTLLPNVRLIVMLRDPVQRTLSGLFHSIRLGLEHLPPAQALAAEAERLEGAEAQLLAGLLQHQSHQVHSYLSRSCYGPQLQRYEELFGKQQLLLLRAEDLFVNPQQVWPRLLAFLGLDPQPPPKFVPRFNAGAGEAAELPVELMASLAQQLEPTYVWMAERYGLEWRRRAY